MFTPHHMSYFICQVSHVRCHVSSVTCHVYFFITKWWGWLRERLLLMGSKRLGFFACSIICIFKLVFNTRLYFMIFNFYFLFYLNIELSHFSFLSFVILSFHFLFSLNFQLFVFSISFLFFFFITDQTF